MRIAPATQPYAADVQAAFARLPADWGPPFAIFTVLARDPDLLQRFLRGSVGYRPDSRLTLRQREVLLLRVCANCGCRYEWGLRVHFFQKAAGLAEAQVRASVQGAAEDAAWEADDHVLLRLADALHDDCDISDVLWDELRAAFAEDAILELLLLAGYYRTVAYLANGLRLPMEKAALCHPWPERQTGARKEATS
jgi:alkylhydroperoxidase family enzyme